MVADNEFIRTSLSTANRHRKKSEMFLAVLSVDGRIKVAFNGLVVKGALCFGF